MDCVCLHVMVVSWKCSRYKSPSVEGMLGEVSDDSGMPCIRAVCSHVILTMPLCRCRA